MRNAEKSVYFLLEGGAAGETISSSYEFLRSSQLDIRFIVDRDYLYESAEFSNHIAAIKLTDGRDIVKFPSEEVWEIGYNRFRTGPIKRGMRQCIIFDRKQLLCGDADLKVSFENGGEELASLLQRFDATWKTPNYYTAEEYRSNYRPGEREMFGQRPNVRVPRRPGREMEYYYLLRSCLDERCVGELVQATRTGKDESRQIAIESLKVIRDQLYSTVMSEKGRKAIIEKIDAAVGK
jgi:hypothetical protein